MANALFVCVQNAGRSQMSAAAFEQLAGGRHEARSGGTHPANEVNPVVVKAMLELGIDIAGRVPHRIERSDVEWADVVVRMGCGDECPYVAGKRYLDWDIRDAKGLELERVRAIRDDIVLKVRALVAELDR